MNFFEQLQSNAIPLTTATILVNLTVAFVVGFGIAMVYRLTNRQRVISRSFQLTIVILAMVVALVMMVIGNSVARAFSLVGALSIIRFRTVVKDNRDIAYIFFGLAGGMAAGVGAYQLAIFGVALIAFFIMTLDFIDFGKSRKGIYLLRFRIEPTDADEAGYLEIFDKYFSSYKRLTLKSVKMGHFIEHSFLVRLKRNINEQDIIADISALEGMDRVSLLEEGSESEV
ncbi:MAG: DUF4956 domain-containing protein [Candidatus Electryonea clarkiae]|nr:DUF4956 domain-containing protein [Candidatus Electryonea clarkiae]MDP8288149.1 DUF4956 domain-containing protein [Candidatus Electryonea clarkiae]